MNTTIYKMMYHVRNEKVSKVGYTAIERFELVYVLNGNNYAGIIPLVAVYKINEVEWKQ